MRERVGPGTAVVIIALAVFAVVALLFGFTVVSTEEEASLTVEFDPAVYVDDNWDSIQTAIKEDAVPLADVVGQIEIGADGKVATEELIPVAEGLGVVATEDAQVYRVTGSGTVTDVDLESSKGSIGIDLEGYDGPIEVRLWVGTRIPSDNSSIRDATGFIGFGDFREQTEYGQVAKEINKRVVENLEGLETENLVGQEIAFTGALGMRTANLPILDLSTMYIVPIEVTS
jgi:predicted lipoprotein